MIASTEANQSHAHNEERCKTHNIQGKQLGQSDNASSHRHSEKSIRHLAYTVRNTDTTKTSNCFRLLINGLQAWPAVWQATKRTIICMVREILELFSAFQMKAHVTKIEVQKSLATLVTL